MAGAQDSIKPNLTSKEAAELITKLFGLEDLSLTELNSYDDRNFLVRAKNTRSSDLPLLPEGYVFKVTNSSDSKNEPLLEGQNNLMLFLKQRNITAPYPLKTLSGKYFTTIILPDADGSEKKYIVRLLNFLPGQILKGVSGSLDLYRDVGVFLGKMNKAMKEFHHPVFDTHKSLWHLKSAPDVLSYIFVVKETNRQRIVKEVIHMYKEEIQRRMNSFEEGLIHGDFNEQNILVGKMSSDQWKVVAALDFGDVNYACYLFEIAAAIAYMMLEAQHNKIDPFQCGREVLHGYTSEWPTKFTIPQLKIAICARLCQSLVLGLYNLSLQPENIYVADTQSEGWKILELLWAIDDQSLTEKWSLFL